MAFGPVNVVNVFYKLERGKLDTEGTILDSKLKITADKEFPWITFYLKVREIVSSQKYLKMKSNKVIEIKLEDKCLIKYNYDGEIIKKLEVTIDDKKAIIEFKNQ